MNRAKIFINHLVCLVLILSTLFFPANTVFAEPTTNVPSSIVLNSVSIANIGSLKQFDFNNNLLHISTDASQFTFSMREIANKSAVAHAETYSSETNGIICNLLHYGDYYTLEVINKNESPIKREEDVATNFIAVYGKNVSSIVDDNLIKATIQSNDSDKITPLTASTLHVLASGTSIPFLISSGSSEGWCTSTSAFVPNYSITDMRYSITYNWPSDGISLWYDYNNSEEAYHSPAWPSAGLTYVSGSWLIDQSKGKFLAETSVSALVKGIPLMWSIYSISDIH